MIQTIVIAVTVIVLLLWLRRVLRISIPTVIVVGAVGALLVYLTLSGRMNWLFTVAATVVLAVIRLLRSPFAYIVLGWLRRILSRRRTGPAVFRSEYVLIRLDPFSGLIDGEVLRGNFAGSRLSRMSEQQLNELLEECTGSDPGAVRILNIYLRYLRRFGFGQARGGDDQGGTEGFDDARAPSLAQACEILGVGEHDDWQTVAGARQRLLSRLHPDKGGSVWIAQRINAAWEVVRARHKHSPEKPRSPGAQEPASSGGDRQPGKDKDPGQ